MAEPRKPRAKSNAEPGDTHSVIQVRVIPRSSRINIVQEGPSEYKVRLTSPPVEGAANEQLLKVLANILNVPLRQIRLLSGERGRIKRIQIRGLNLSEIQERLA